MPATAFITGASKGIGEAIGRAYARRGLSVALAARTGADVCRVADSICAEGGRAIGVACDVTAPDSVAAAVEKVRAELGPITVLVNNAGLGGSHKFLGHDDALWHRLIDVNLNSAEAYRVEAGAQADLALRAQAEGARNLDITV